MQFTRDRELELIYEGMTKPKVLPPGIKPEDVLTIDQYNKEICGKDIEEEETVEESELNFVKRYDSDEKNPQDKYDPRVGANIKDVSDERMREIIAKRAEREKLKPITPQIHRSNVIDKDGNPIDPEKLKKLIMTRPRNILSQNEKLKKTSETTGDDVHNLNLPAFTGLYVDESTPEKEFRILRTCPSAGQCVNFCYAMKGSYIQYPDVSAKQSKNLNFLMNDWEGFKEQLTAEIMLLNVQAKRKGQRLVIRWHDSGDFFTDGYLEIAFAIARETPSVTHYAYTKEFHKFEREDKPENFIFNISAGGFADKYMDIKKHKSSDIVHKELFADLAPKEKGQKWNFTPEDVETLKDRVSKHFDIDRKLIKTYDELLKTPYNTSDDKPKWFVLIKPGDGDLPAYRKDVQSTLLLIH